MAGSAHANLVGYEGFGGYSPGELAAQATGSAIGFNEAAWSTNGGGGNSGKVVVADGLTYTNGGTLVTTPGHLRSNGGFARAHRGLTTPFSPAAPGGGEMWLSYLFRADGPADGDGNQVRFYTSGGGFDGQVISVDVPSIQVAPGTFRHKVRPRAWFVDGPDGGTAKFSNPNGDVDLIVMQYVLDDSDAPGNQGAIRVWVDPVIGGAAPDAASADSTMTGLGGFDAMDRLSFFSPNSGDFQVSWDEIRWGSTFSSVTPVPEPASLVALGAIGAMGLLRRR
jgi:hypothetical protein